ncbi:gamma-glutamyltransferase [Antarctobacter heliothermus]|uniref:Gamma-glutamyltransferase n=1 Tax=Antarctobacter heliothermus TaxID=74033 RepID=A0A222E7J8_9RHOB|nr:gamma-glutamyltransferase family protein [Antarctobacter heliothermus]ASP22152.1 gamma-glutamyltransferase [Antarctobacter heliothermus]
MTFTTRPELTGTFGMVATTHWLASAVGMKLLEAGGNAFDAAVAAGFVLNVVEPQLNGPLGDMPALVWPAGAEAPQMICGQGTAPAGATVAHYRDQGLDLIPGSGLLATVTPGAFDAWMVMLRDHGTKRLRDVLEPAIHYADAGHPILARAVGVIADQADLFRTEWPTSAAVWLPGGDVPVAGRLFRNPDLAAFWTRLLTEAETVEGREAQIEAARRAFSQGFVAEAIDDYMRDACVMDGAGARRKGVLTGADMAGWQATVEPALQGGYHGWDIWKGGFWTQGPALLQSLNLLAQTGIADTDPRGADFVHLAVEAMKLAFADREAYYGDPDFFDIPAAHLLSGDYARERAGLIGPWASMDQRPGLVPGQETLAEAFVARAARAVPKGKGAGGGEPTMAHLDNREGDTVHVDVVDRWGNMVSATPSGGWLQSNPVVPGLGVALNTRAQMFWLDEGLPTTLAPGRRPRTTLTPSMARAPDGTRLAFGTPGGDSQDQWQLFLLLRMVHHGMNLQEAIDAPLVLSKHLQASFYPRGSEPGGLMVEPGFGAGTIDALRGRGHKVTQAEPWSLGRLTAVARGPDGVLRAGATPRLMQAYAAGR